MKAYRFLTGKDDSEFCHRVTAMLNAGWELAGPASLTYDASRQTVICGQPMVKDVPELEYSRDLKLGEL